MRVSNMPIPVNKSGDRQSSLDQAPAESALPHQRIAGTKKELARLARLLSSKPAKPTDALIHAMKG